MDQVSHIEDLIVCGAEGFFDGPGSHRMDLHVTIRIAFDFHKYLSSATDSLVVENVRYMMDTIRSGMDQFFLLGYSCSAINVGGDVWRFDHEVPRSFQELREAFMRRFDNLIAPESSAIDRLASLLALTHLELVFLAQHFPCILLENGS
jgi:hypothetical protein